MTNPFTEFIGEEEETKPNPKSLKENPFTDVVKEGEEFETVQYNGSITKSLENTPDRQMEINKLSEDMKLPSTFVDRNLDHLKANKKKEELRQIQITNPMLAEVIAKPEKMALAQDDIDNLKKTELIAGRFKFKPKQESLLDSIGRGFEINTSNLEKSYYVGQASQGMGDDTVYQNIVDIENRVRKLHDSRPGYAKEFDKKFGKEALELDKAYSDLVTSFEQSSNADLLQRLSLYGTESVRTAGELMDLIGVIASNPKGLVETSSMSLANSFAPLAASLLGAKAGAVAGAPLGPVGATGGAIAGATIAGVTTGTILEYAAEIEGDLKERGINFADPEALKKAFNDKEFVTIAKDKAFRKAITTASVETMFNIIGGALIGKAVKGGTTAAKVGAVAKGQALDVVGEGLGEFAGQAAKEKDVKKASPGEAVLEAASALVTAGGMSTFGYAFATTRQKAQVVKQAYDKAQDARAFHQGLDDVTEIIQESKAFERDPEIIKDILNNGSDNQDVYFQADEFEDHWNALGENPKEKADELLPNGRQDLEQAKQEGNALRVSLGDYVTKFGNEESFTELSKLARRDIDSFSLKETETVTANIDSLLKELSKTAKADQQKARIEIDARKAVQNDIEGQLSAVGQKAKDAKYAGILWASNTNALGTIIGEDAIDFHRRRSLEIVSPEESVEKKNVLEQRTKRGFTVKKGEKLKAQLPERVSLPRLTPFKSPENFVETPAKLKTGLSKVLAETSQVNEQSGKQLKLSQSSLNFLVDKIHDKLISTSNRKKKRKSQILFNESLTALKNLPTLMKTAVPTFDTEDGNEVYYAFGNGELNTVGVKFEVDTDGNIQDIEVAVNRQVAPIGQADINLIQSRSLPDNISLAEFQQYVNAGRNINMLFQDDVKAINKINQDVMGFYSKIENEVQKMDFKSMPAKDLKNRINKIEGLKKEEIEWTGLFDWLEGIESKVSKEQVTQFLQQNGVKVTQTVLSPDYAGPATGGIQSVETDWQEPENVAYNDYDPHGDYIVEIDEEIRSRLEDDYYIEIRIPEIEKEIREEDPELTDEEVKKETMERAEKEAEESAIEYAEEEANNPDSDYAATKIVDDVNDIEIWNIGYDGDWRYGDAYGESLGTSSEEEAKIRAIKHAVEQGDIDFEGLPNLLFTRDDVTFPEPKIEYDNDLIEKETAKFIKENKKELETEVKEVVHPQFYKDTDLKGEELAEELAGDVESLAEDKIREDYKNGEFGPVKKELVIKEPFNGRITGNDEDGYIVSLHKLTVGDFKGTLDDAKNKLLEMAEEEKIISRREEDKPELTQEQLKKELIEPKGKTNWEEYTVEGGDNYREVLLNLPDIEGKFTEDAHFDGHKNFIAHLRLKDRVTEDGQKILYIEEMQSDWHQQGRREGYKRDLTPEEKKQSDALEKQIDAKQKEYDQKEKEIKEKASKDHSEEFTKLEKEADEKVSKIQKKIDELDQQVEQIRDDRQEIQKKIDKSNSNFEDELSEGTLTKEREDFYNKEMEGLRDERSKNSEILSAKKLESRKLDDEIDDLEEPFKSFIQWAINTGRMDIAPLNQIKVDIDALASEKAELLKPTKSDIPDAPFKQTEAWSMLAFKRALRMAVEQGYDSIGWTPGHIHSNRWTRGNFSQRVDFERIEGTDDYNLAIHPTDGRDPITTKRHKGQLAELLGESAYNAIIESDGKGTVTDELNVKDVGLEVHYDKVLPNAIKKYLKKIDKKAKVGTAKVTTGTIEGFTKETMDQLKSISLKRIEDAIKKADKDDASVGVIRTLEEFKEFYLTELEFPGLAKDEKQNKIEEYSINLNIASLEYLDIKNIKQGKIGVSSLESWNLPITDKMIESISNGQPLFQRDSDGPKGYLDLSDPQKFVIGLMKNANKSTILHEMGHAFLENMKIVSEHLDTLNPDDYTEAQKQFRADQQSVLEHFGLDNIYQVSNEQHEEWARLTEAYLMEGKAPSKKLRKAFNTFKTWLINIYRNLSGVEKAAGQKLALTPEMREIFNRLLATQDEIEDLNQSQGFSANELTEYLAVLGIGESKEKEKIMAAHLEAKDEAELILYKKHLKQLRKKKTKAYKARKKVLTQKFTEEADINPLYMATDSIVSGEIDGEAPAGFENLKFNKEMLKTFLSPNDFKAFPKNLYSNDGGYPNLVSDVLGWNSADDLLSAILTNPSKKDFIKFSTQKELSKEFPDYMSPTQENQMKADAINAVDNDKRGTALRLEFDVMVDKFPSETKKLIQQTVKRLPNTKEVKELARDRVLATPYQDARPSRYQQVEQKNRREAGVFMTRGDFDKASKAKLNELVNFQMSKESAEIREKIEKDIKKNNDRLRKSDKDLSKSFQMDMIKSAQSILARFGMITEVETKKLEVYLDQLKRYDPKAYAKVDGLTSSLVDFEDKPYKQLRTREVQEILETVDALYNLARQEKQILVDGKLMDKEEALDEMIAQLEEIPRQAIKKEKDLGGRAKGFLLSAKANMTRMEHLISFLDRGKATGAFRSFIFNRANDAQTDYTQKMEQRLSQLNALIDKHFSGLLRDSREISINEYFRDVDPQLSSLTRSEIVMALIHSGNDSNKKKLLLGRNWGTETDFGILNTAAYDSFIKDMIEQGVITKDMMDGVQAVWDLFEDIKPEIQKTHKEVYGYFFEEIEANEIDTPWGTYRGGYAPAVTDPLLVSAEAARQNEASTEQDVNRFTFATTPKGFREKRIENYNRALSLDFRLIKSHVEKTVRFTTLESAVQDLNKIINDREFIDSMHDVNNTWINEVFTPWLARFASQQTTKPADSRAGRAAANVFNFLRSNANMQLMFMNVVNTAENISDIIPAMVEVNPKRLMQGINAYMFNNKEVMETINRLSPEMKIRLESQIFEINDQYKEMTIAKNKGQELLQKTQDLSRKHTYILQKAVQNVVEISSWHAAFNQELERNGNNEKAAAKYADSLTRRVMGSNRPIDVANIEAGNFYEKIVLTFYGYFLNKANLIAFAPENKKLKAVALGAVAPAIVGALLRKAVKGSDPEKELPEEALEVLVMEPIRFGAAMIPGGGTAFRFIQGKFNDKIYDDRLSISPLQGMFEASQGIVNIFSKDEIRGRDMRDSLNFFGTVSGLPLGTAGKPVGFMIDLEQGKQRAENPVDVTRGIVTGRSGKR